MKLIWFKKVKFCSVFYKFIMSKISIFSIWKVLGVVIILSAVVFLGLDEILAEKRADKLEKKKPSEELSLAD